MDDNATPTYPSKSEPLSAAAPTSDEAHSSARPIQADPVSDPAMAMDKPAAQLKARWWSPLPLLTLLAIVFYGQGRAFTQAYLDYFGLHISQFPVSPDDAYWYAFMGLSMVAGKGPPTLLHTYPQVLRPASILTIVIVSLSLIVWAGRRCGWWSGLARSIERLRNMRWLQSIWAKAPKDMVKHVAYGGIPGLMLMSMPLMFLILTSLLAAVIAYLVIPFWMLGTAWAEEVCSSPAAASPVVHYVGNIDANIPSQTSSPARLLQCGTDFCALIRDGEAFVIARTAVQWVGGIPIHRPPTGDGKVRPELQLCFVPQPKKAAASSTPKASVD